MTTEQKMMKIEAWANSSHSYLSESCQYARGYKAGLAMAKSIVRDMLTERDATA